MNNTSTRETPDEIGDLGCNGVDVEAFKRRCRAPLFPGRVNRWILVRTRRDLPTSNDVTQTAQAVMARWFKSESDWPAPIDAAAEWRGTTRSGGADLIRVVRVSQTRIGFGAERVARREDLAQVPTVYGADPLWVELEFAYRGTRENMPWPAWRAWFGFGIWCPVDADWMLAEVGTAKLVAPPERTTGEKAADVVEDAASKGVSGVLRIFGVPLVIAGALYFGANALLRR